MVFILQCQMSGSFSCGLPEECNILKERSWCAPNSSTTGFPPKKMLTRIPRYHLLMNQEISWTPPFGAWFSQEPPMTQKLPLTPALCQVILDAGHPSDERNDRSVVHLRPEQVQKSSWCALDKRKMEVFGYRWHLS